MFGFRRTEVIGVDIGSFAVKIVQLRKTQSGWAVTAAGIIDIAEGGRESTSRSEANSLRKTKFAVCAIGGPEVAVRDFEFPAMPPEETDRAILLEAKQVCPFNTDDIVLDYRLIPENNGKTKGYLVVANNKLVKGKTRLAKKAHLNCALMDVDGLALLNCFNELEKPRDNHGTAILNIGSRHTTLAIEGSNGWPFIRDLNYAGDSIIRTIAAENDVPPESVKTMLSGDSKEVQSDAYQSLEKACSRLISDITKTVRFYGTRERASDVRKILVCGGFALFGEFIRLLDSQLPMDVKLWNPFEKMRCHAGRNHRAALLKGIVRKNGPAMAVAAGLAMRSI